MTFQDLSKEPQNHCVCGCGNSGSSLSHSKFGHFWEKWSQYFLICISIKAVLTSGTWRKSAATMLAAEASLTCHRRAQQVHRSTPATRRLRRHRRRYHTKCLTITIGTSKEGIWLAIERARFRSGFETGARFWIFICAIGLGSLLMWVLLPHRDPTLLK